MSNFNDDGLTSDSSGPKKRFYSTTDLCRLYDVTYKTFRRMIDPLADLIGKRVGRFYNINQVTIIFRELGTPEQRSNGNNRGNRN